MQYCGAWFEIYVEVAGLVFLGTATAILRWSNVIHMAHWDTYKCVYKSHFSNVKNILTIAVQSSIHDDTLKVSLKH